MDGIAVRSADLARASPSSPLRLPVTAFEVVDTGDPLPAGRDAVVRAEQVSALPDATVELTAPIQPGRHVRGVGEDVHAGELLLPAGHRIRPVDAAVLAGAGCFTVSVSRPPLVAILPTGDEVRPIGTEIGRGEILDTNSLMLEAMAAETGCTPIRLPIVGDDPSALKGWIGHLADQFDLILVIAGSSAGRDDHTAAVLAELGEVAVRGVAIKPGHPVVLGVVHRVDQGVDHGVDHGVDQGVVAVPVIGVPGYPLSAANVFDTFARPMIRILHGAAEHDHVHGQMHDRVPGGAPTVAARLAHPIASPVGVQECVPVRLERRAPCGDLPAGLLAVPIGRGAGALSVLMRAHGLLRIPAGSAGLDAGAELHVEPLPGSP